MQTTRTLTTNGRRTSSAALTSTTSRSVRTRARSGNGKQSPAPTAALDSKPLQRTSATVTRAIAEMHRRVILESIHVIASALTSGGQTIDPRTLKTSLGDLLESARRELANPGGPLGLWQAHRRVEANAVGIVGLIRLKALFEESSAVNGLRRGTPLSENRPFSPEVSRRLNREATKAGMLATA